MSSVSSADPVSTLLAAKAVSREQAMATAIVRQQAEQERALADMLAKAAAAAPPGQGTLFDRRA